MTVAPVSRLSRPYVLTGGRTRGRGDELPLEAMALTIGPAWRAGWRVPPEAFDIADLCLRPRSIAEVAALLGLPLGVTRVLVSDLADDDALQVGATVRVDTPAPARIEMLERLLVGLRAL